MASVFILIGCLLSYEEYDNLQKELLDTSYFEDTSVQEESIVEDPESSKYIYLGEDDCLSLSRNADPFVSPPWSFSFRLTKELIQEKKLYSLFSIDNQSILMQYSNEGRAGNTSYIGITICPDILSGNICDTKYLERPLTTSFTEGDRITISVGEQNSELVSPITIYQQGTPIAGIEDFRSTFTGTSALSFGCPVNDLRDIFDFEISDEDSITEGGWNAGVDSLLLFDKKLDALQVQAMIESENDNRLFNFLSNPINENIDISYWNLGEDVPPDIMDSIGDRDGEIQGTGYLIKSYETEE